MSIIGSELLLGAAGAGGYEIERSLRFNSADSAYLNRTPGSAGNRKTWTWAGWVKKSGNASFQTLFANAVGSTNTTYFVLSLGRSADDPIYVSIWDVNLLVTTQVFRDPSAWYHIVLAFDATQGTNPNKLKLYVNGSEVTTFATDNRSSISNQDYAINAVESHTIGSNRGSNYFNGYLADVHFIDGQALDPSSFGEFDDNGVWQPIAYAGSYGTNGFHLDFADNSTAAALGTDTSGNGNTWTVNNISVTAGAGNDSLVDSPTNYGTDTGAGGEVRGNYCTWNPLAKLGSTTDTLNVSNGNLAFSDSANIGTIGTIGMSSGKWYWELNCTSLTASQLYFGMTNATIGSRVVAFVGIRDTGVLSGSANGATTNGSGTTAFTTGDVVSFAYDANNARLFVAKNGTWLNSSDPAAGTNASFTDVQGSTLYPLISDNNTTATIDANFGQRPFAYTAPSGFKALCTTNLAEPTIADGSTAMDVALYTGNGSTQTISGLNFSPDFVWVKARNVGYSHRLWDVVRGATKGLLSDGTSAEFTEVNGLTSFNSDGFSVGTSLSESAKTYVAWTWDAGSSTVTNTEGSITSQVRANASAGFSVVTYTGTGVIDDTQTIGHGLNTAPAFVLCKRRDLAGDWWAGHVGAGWTKGAYLQVADAFATSSKWWSNTAPTSSVVTLGQYPLTGAGSSFVAYCFAPVAGYSSFGSYVGNGVQPEGPFIYTGFKPAFLMIKSSSAGLDGWFIMDNKRPSYNLVNKYLYANTSDSEADANICDFCANGFKIRYNYAGINQNGATYIYAAFAEHPFQSSRAR
jgi:hypothetical protein